MSAIITEKFRQHNANQFYESFTEASASTYYLFLGKSTAFTSSTTGGSDSFGNVWTDSNTNDDYDYSWVDISGSGDLYSFPSNDDAGESIAIGFDFSFYGENYNSLIVNPNGWVGFGDDNNA